MPSSVWIAQDTKQVKRHGTETASWYCFWIDLDGKQRCKSYGAGETGREKAEKQRSILETQLNDGTYQSNLKKTWAQFRQEYEEKVLAVKDVRHREEARRCLDQFQRIIKPGRMTTIRTAAVDDFVAKRRKEPRFPSKREKGEGQAVSPATVNKELRYLRAALRKARKWKYITETPDFEFLKEPQKLPTYVPPEHFALLYRACDHARLPIDLTCTAADWWRGLLVAAYMTGWRISALLKLRREDVDLKTGLALSRAEDNKGKRDQKVQFHPLIIEHLQRLRSFDPVFFPWNRARRLLFEEFLRIQGKADFKADSPKGHYGFHDLRRAFATMNADRLTPDALQLLMQHKDYQTTQRYISMARQLNPAIANLFVPDLSEKPKTGS
jgi:integrase